MQTQSQQNMQTMPTIFNPFEKGKKIGYWGTITVCMLFGATFLWLILAPLNGAVIIPAQIKVETSRKQVQHLEGGIVKSILVKAGDKVKVGQPLVMLEDVQLDASVATLHDQLDAEMARNARALAERLQKNQITFPQAIIERAATSKKVQSLIQSEQQLFNAKRKQLTSQIALLKQQKAQVNTEIGGLANQISSADQNRKLITEEKTMNEALAEKGFIQKSRVMAFDRALSEKDEQRGNYLAENAVAKQKLIDLDLKAIGLTDDYIKRATDEATESNRLILELQEKLRPMQDALKRQVITSPASGEVVDLRIHTAGGVVKPGEILMEIVPEKTQLLIEGKARPEDIADLILGTEADVQITAFKQRSTPLLKGKLTYISADSLIDTSTGYPAPYYLTQITIDQPSLKWLPGALGPGMPAVVFVKTRERTGMDYLLEPITDNMRKAFKEY